MEKKITTLLFGKEVTLDYGIRFSKRLRERFPQFLEEGIEHSFADLVLMVVASALPDDLAHHTNDEVFDEIDGIEDESVIPRCLLAYENAMGFIQGLSDKKTAMKEVLSPQQELNNKRAEERKTLVSGTKK